MNKKNMELWDKVKQPPKSALKTIGGGRLKGMTDINPMWRFEAMTEHFGKCGEGWSFKVSDYWSENGADGTKAVFAIVNLYTGKDNDPIQGIGGSMFIQKETAGLRTNDEAYKMAVTDALGTAMKMLGFGADIYAGKWDGSKYNITEEKIKVKQDIATATEVQEPPVGKAEYDAMDDEGKLHVNATAQSIKDLFIEGTPESKRKAYLEHVHGVDSDFKMALWYVLKPQTEIRRYLKQIQLKMESEATEDTYMELQNDFQTR